MVDDKIDSRARGPIQILNRQPMEEIYTNDVDSQCHAITDSNDSQESPLDLSKTGKFYRCSVVSRSPDVLCVNTNNTCDREMLLSHLYEKPKILTEPKLHWHYRSIKDLAKQHIPLLSGAGRQRTPIRMTVPNEYTRLMYVKVSVVTHAMQPHESKVIVPAKTKVRMDQLSYDNNLNCLNFDECNPIDYFDPITRQIYLQITPTEHSAQLKEIRIHMFNLYQDQWITKQIIEAKQLDLCRLAFQLYIVENERYIPVSPISFTSIIRERNCL
ncbi:unnamed protein product [Rotaria sordida]|uniref:Uncharacterized protein n=2 Tax=Rotaria sordida TaxID=392033 RepID=A0A814L3D5_9BILA|nr:unnamed protein product [Rotaria sordida]